MTKDRPCMHADCPYPALGGIRKCYWHDLMRKPMEEQIDAAQERDIVNHAVDGHEERSRVPKGEWPDGERWCAGCQGFVPLFYCSGSRCKAHASLASHSQRLKATYGIDRDIYEALLTLQGGRCYICRQLPRSKRLAVDHDHQTGAVRGLLCADVERGCNHAVLGSLEARSVDGPIQAAKRLIEYLEITPFKRLQFKEAHHEAQKREDRPGVEKVERPISSRQEIVPVPEAGWRDDPDWSF